MSTNMLNLTMYSSHPSLYHGRRNVLQTDDDFPVRIVRYCECRLWAGSRVMSCGKYAHYTTHCWKN